MEVNYQGPIRETMNKVANTMHDLNADEKHWFIGGTRCLAVALTLLKQGKIIAVPTDTIYGLAGLAQNPNCVEKLYEIKGRDKNKPLAISLSSVSDIWRWGEIDHLPKNLIISLLPGPVTIVVKRKPTLNPSLNPGCETIGIRVSSSKFVRTISKILKQPLALTSANSSNDPSSVHPDEFPHLWERLGGIFYTTPNYKMAAESNRVGSTIVDLATPGQFNIIRRGIDVDRALRLLQSYGLKENCSE